MKDIEFLKSMRVRSWRLCGILGILIAASSLWGGCSRNKDCYEMDFDFSVNVATIRPDWPEDLSKLNKAQQDVIKVKGLPERVHVWWLPSGTIIDKSTFSKIGKKNSGTKRENAPLSWIYLTKGEEVLFIDPPHWRVQPLSDKLRVVCESGDPQEIRYRSMPGGDRMEEWFYYNQGIIYRFSDEHLVETDKSSIPPLPNYMTR